MIFIIILHSALVAVRHWTTSFVYAAVYVYVM